MNTLTSTEPRVGQAVLDPKTGWGSVGWVASQTRIFPSARTNTFHVSILKLRSASASSTPSCVGVLVADADDYHLYITNLPREEFKPEEISLLYRARWEVELLFKELKSQYALDSFEIGKEEIVRIQVLAALLTISVSRAILRALCDRVAEAEDTRIILLDLAAYYGYPPPDLGEFLYQEAIQPVTRRSLLTDVTNGLAGGSPA